MLPALRQTNWIDSPFDLLDREFGRLLRRGWREDDGGLVGSYPVDIREDDDYVYVDAEMPGFKRDQINVTLENGMLQITGQRPPEKELKGQQHLTERRFLRVSRSFTLPTNVDENKVEAHLTEGVLHLKFPKREEVKPRRIEVK
jgi:HSP20 family protein